MQWDVPESDEPGVKGSEVWLGRQCCGTGAYELKEQSRQPWQWSDNTAANEQSFVYSPTPASPVEQIQGVK